MRSSFVLKNFKSLVCACMLFNQSFAVCKHNENTKLSGLMCSDFLYHDHAQSWDSKSLLLQSSKEDELEKIHTYSRLSALLYQSIEFNSWKNMFNIGGVLPIIGNKSRLLFIDGQAKLYNGKESEISFGAGIRAMPKDNILLGINAFGDVRFLPHHHFIQNSLGAEAFFGPMQLRFNYYVPKGKTYVSSIKKFARYGRAAIIEEEYANGGFDAEFGIKPKNANFNNFGLYAGLYRFGEQENQMKGYRLRGEFLIDLTRKSHLIFSPEFFTDNIRNNNFAAKLSLQIKSGKDYGDILTPVVRDRDIIISKREAEKEIKKIVFDADKDHEIELVFLASVIQKTDPNTGLNNPKFKDTRSEITNKDDFSNILVMVDTDFLPGDCEEDYKGMKFSGPTSFKSCISHSNASLDVHEHKVGVDTFEFKIKDNQKLKNAVIANTKVKLEGLEGNNFENVTFTNTEIISDDSKHLLKNDKNVKIINSVIEDNTNKAEPLFYSDKETSFKSDYFLKDVTIKTKNDLTTASLFGSDDKSRNNVTLGGKLTIERN